MARVQVTNIFKQLKSRPPSFPIPEKIWQDPRYFIAFGFGTGAIPIAPGTFGTLMAIPFYLLVRPLPLYAYLIFVMMFIVASVWLSEYISRAIHVHDHPGMNIDEFAGFFVTMINAPHGFVWILLGFLLFRLLDIWKPWPINYLDEHVHGGIGMILDDVFAGLVSMIIMQILSYLIGGNL